MKQMICRDNCKSNKFICYDDILEIINELNTGSISGMISSFQLKQKLKKLIK